MPRTTPENLLISALINTQNPMAGRTYGLLPEMLVGHRDEYNWVLSYYSNFGSCPSKTQLLTQYPDFVFSDDETGVQWPVFEVKKIYASKMLLRRIGDANAHLIRGRVEEAYEVFAGQVLELTSEPLGSVLEDPGFLDDYDREQSPRVPMPWDTLQGVTDGIGAGELWYMAARQGQGKSSLLTYIAAHALTQGYNVAMYSLEMSKRQIQSRMHATLGWQLRHQVSSREMLRRRFDKGDYKTILEDIQEKIPGKMTIHDSSMGRVSPGVIAARADEADLILVDYIGLMYSDDGTPAVRDWRVIAEISNGLNEVVQSKDARIISASQINREGDSRSHRPPALKNLAQSDFLGNDASVVVTMKRYGLGATINSVEKNRFGPSHNLYWTAYDADRGDFKEVTVDKADDIRDQDE